jgi:hypothetical protein
MRFTSIRSCSGLKWAMPRILLWDLVPVKCVGFDGFALMPVKSKRPLGPALRAFLIAVRVAIGEMLAQKEVMVRIKSLTIRSFVPSSLQCRKNWRRERACIDDHQFIAARVGGVVPLAGNRQGVSNKS